MVHLQELHEKHAKSGLVVLGMNIADKREIALELMRDRGVTYPNILDSSKAAIDVGFRDYKISGVPVNYVIDRAGRVFDAWYGYRKGDPRVDRALRLLEQKD